MLLQLALIAQLAAFPGAMGGGTLTAGGRDGQIIEITNLNDSGAGSFRACVTAPGPRTCICRTGGVVPIRSDVTISQPFLTFDGQTCPGGGLILGDGKISGRPLNIVTHDVVVRYLSLWMDNPNIHSGPDTGTTGIEIGTGSYNNVLDHISCEAAGNKCIISYTSETDRKWIIHDDTLQWSILGLPNQGHPVGPMTDTCCFAYLSINQDFHHNYFPWIGHRIALANANQTHWVNNLTYNWCDPSAGYGFAMFPQGPSANDLIGNIWEVGNMNKGCSNAHPVNINATGSSDCTANCWGNLTQPSDYLSGNVCAQGTDWQCAAQAMSEGGPEAGPVPTAWRRTSPLPSEPNPIVPDSTTGLDSKILATIGNSQGLTCDGSWFSRRNAIDMMLVQAYPNGQGQLFNGQYNAPTAAKGIPCDEDPVNHLPLAYEAKYLIPAGTPPWTIGKSGYPIIEEYANGQGTTPPPPTSWSGWLGSDVLPGAAIGKQVVVGAGAGPVRSAGCGTADPISPQPTNYKGSTVLVIGGPASCNGGIQYWQVQSGSTPPSTITSVTSTCTPPSTPTGGTSTCSAQVQGTGSFNPAVTWSTSAGSISSTGIFTAPSTPVTATITATSVQDPTKAGPSTVQVTSTPPPVTYPTVTISIGVPPGPITTLTCTANQSTGAYSCH
jgi:hypothetical protein